MNLKDLCITTYQQQQAQFEAERRAQEIEQHRQDTEDTAKAFRELCGFEPENVDGNTVITAPTDGTQGTTLERTPARHDFDLGYQPAYWQVAFPCPNEGAHRIYSRPCYSLYDLGRVFTEGPGSCYICNVQENDE